MGSRPSKPDINTDGSFNFTICIKTGDRPKAGTDANVYIALHGKDGKSADTKLDAVFHDDFERGQQDKFKVKKQTFSDVEYIELWRDENGLFDDWFIDTITIVSDHTKKQTVFPIFRWIRENYRYNFIPNETSLPQDDKRKEQRQLDITEKRSAYELQAKAPGLPMQIKCLPDDEKFSFDYRWDITKMKAKLLLTSKLVRLTSGRWKTIDDIKNVYTKKIFRPPSDTNRWRNDTAFGMQRIAGMNNIWIRLCKSIPEKLGVKDDNVAPFLEGLTLQEALSKGRIFIIDHSILDGCPVADGLFTCAPIALFYQRNDGYLVPVAIQLFQQKGEDNPVFLPSDSEYTWIIAKMWFNNADTSIHQAITHLGFTHLIMEGFAIVSHRNFSQSHPLFKLLAPHFLYLISINFLAVTKLTSPGGWVDKTLTCGVVGLFELIRRHKTKWRMDIEGTLPADLKERGVDSKDKLPHYYFREDALAMYDAIHKYVTNYVTLYYENDEIIEADEELQNWRQEMVKSETENGLNLLGVPGEDGKFTRREHVIIALTSIIYTCSVGHGSANFKQYDEYGFPPNCPCRLTGQPPRSKAPLSEADALAILPDRKLTLDIMVVTQILSNRGTQPLGDFEVNYIFDPKALDILKMFCQDLKRISEGIRSKNKTRTPPFAYLDPAEIPNAISI